ncbi:MAG: choice-of-anchor B family protein [Litorilituus sp.]|jgi:choice-of-anchor B domain-containing protein|nr:choice-of-anchor B family protein [Litorilituus sp.]
MNKFLTSLSLLFLLSLSFNSYGHSEHDKSRFVSPNGHDTGRCNNVLRPCRTIAYAVSQANKGDKVLVSAGRFAIASSDELFYLKSALVPVYGGFNRYDHFQSQSPQSNITTLTNIPTDMVEPLREKGFNVLADGKAFANDKILQQKLADYVELSNSQQDELCVNGKAGIFDCENVDLMAHLPLTKMSSKPSAGSDIWGHVDLNTGNEYAIMGLYDGVIIVDVTDPSNPLEVGTIDGVNSSWRDVKVYQYYDETINLWQAYAYATTEGSNTGATDYVAIIDLNNLPNNVSLVKKSKIVTTAHNVYISNVDHSLNIKLPNQTPTLQLVGANSRSGAFQSFALDDPTSLTQNSSTSYGSGYTHDGASLVIDDQRASTDCGVSYGSCTIFIDFNEKEMKLWNITEPGNANQLSSIGYDDVEKVNQYVHSGWGTEDKQFVFLHDEFDEYRGGLNTTVRIFSIEDLNTPIQIGQWTGPTQAIDHNGFVRGNRYYMSNYERGLTILDITDPATPTEVGFFDTYTPANSPSFNGAWGVYPFLPSGNILVSDINSGLYILKDNAKVSAKGQFAFASKEISTEQGVNLTVEVQRNGAQISEAVAVSYQVIQGSAESGSDFTLESGTLNWAAGDNSAKSLLIEINEDLTNKEYPETFFIRLYNPQNGATLGKNSYTTINIAGVPDAGTGSFSTAQATVSEGSGQYIVEVNRIGSTAGELSFNYQLLVTDATLGSDVEDSSGQLSWSDGQNDTKQILLTIIDDDIEEDNESFSLSLIPVNNARLGTNGNIMITIADDDKNEAPVVRLSENFQANTGQMTNLTATASDSDNDEMTYLWEQTSGTTVSLSNAQSLSASFTAPSSAGSLTFRFTATDFRNASSSESVTVSVVAPSNVVTVTPKPSGSGGATAWLIVLLLGLQMRKRNFTS